MNICNPPKTRHLCAKMDIINPPFLNPDEKTWKELQRDFIYRMREYFDSRFRTNVGEYPDHYYKKEPVREFSSIEEALDMMH